MLSFPRRLAQIYLLVAAATIAGGAGRLPRSLGRKSRTSTFRLAESLRLQLRGGSVEAATGQNITQVKHFDVMWSGAIVCFCACRAERVVLS